MNLKLFLALFVLALSFVSSSVSHALDWRGIFISGDDSIDNFDNGRQDLSKMFESRGSLTSTHLSSSEKFISEKNGILAANAENIIPAFENLNLLATQGCLIHMTSHGAQSDGFYLSQAGILPPVTFEKLVDSACGTAPTVILISACFSGQFITEGLKGPNRIILTAARADRPSFGCSADTKYTYWDGCILEEMPQSEKWADLYKNVNACISKKENLIGVNPSEPQAFFGDNTLDWTILH